MILLPAAVLSSIAVVLFVMGYRARSLERLRQIQGFALVCLVVTLLASACLVALFFVLFIDDLLGAMVGVAVPSLIPFAVWLGLAWVKRRREATPSQPDQAELTP